MRPLLLMQADFDGLHDLSDRGRIFKSHADRVSVIEGHLFYDMNKDSGSKYVFDRRIPLSSKNLTIEGWIQSPITSSPTEIILGGTVDGSWIKGFYMGFLSSGFGFSTGSSSQDFAYISNFPTNKPVHFAWVFSNNNKKLYINGSVVLNEASSTAVSTPAYMTFGGGSSTNDANSFGSSAKIHQLIVWDGVKYTANFTPQYINYEQQDSYVSAIPDSAQLVSANFDGIITDRVLIKGTPTERKVVLYRRGDDKLIGKTWSDKAGNYRFENLDSSVEYYVLSIDYERNYNAVIQDMIRTA